MIVPDYWAEARRQHRTAKSQITVRRYGWSVSSQADAQLMAEARAEEALQRIVSGEVLSRREQKVAYGAEGVPIREEVLARHGEEVITRNAYGARCLNSPSALFADVDFYNERGLKPALLVFAILSLASIAAGLSVESLKITFALLLVSVPASVALTHLFFRLAELAGGGAQKIARKRIAAFIAANPDWNLRLYRTPAGYRLLATHQAFEARDEKVRHFFSGVGTDPVYVRMCLNQNCFRARLTAKPWRIGISEHMRPRPGVWPVQPEKIAAREQWVTHYEAQAASFAACHYIESMGSGVIHEALKPIVDLHDRESGALTGAPLA